MKTLPLALFAVLSLSCQHTEQPYTVSIYEKLDNVTPPLYVDEISTTEPVNGAVVYSNKDSVLKSTLCTDMVLKRISIGIKDSLDDRNLYAQLAATFQISKITFNGQQLLVPVPVTTYNLNTNGNLNAVCRPASVLVYKHKGTFYFEVPLVLQFAKNPKIISSRRELNYTSSVLYKAMKHLSDADTVVICNKDVYFDESSCNSISRTFRFRNNHDKLIIEKIAGQERLHSLKKEFGSSYYAITVESDFLDTLVSYAGIKSLIPNKATGGLSY